MYTVYMHIVPNGKRYVGITSGTVSSRFGKNGYNYRSQLFGKAIKKHGWDSIKHIVVATDLSRDWACQLERILIHKYNCADHNYGYNLTYGGEYSVQPTEAVRQKMRDAQLGTRQSEETRKKKSASLTGRTLSAEHRAKISASIKEMHRRKLSN